MKLAEWVERESGLKCGRTVRHLVGKRAIQLEDACDMFLDSLISEPGLPRLMEHPIGDAKVVVSEADKKLKIFTDFPIDVMSTCDWEVDMTEYVDDKCGDIANETDYNRCAESARHRYADTPFKECSDRNINMLGRERPELFDIPLCDLDGAHGHGRWTDLHYTCSIRKDGGELLETVGSLFHNVYEPWIADGVVRIAEARRRRE